MACGPANKRNYTCKVITEKKESELGLSPVLYDKSGGLLQASLS
jgi:hypothetical protein